MAIEEPAVEPARNQPAEPAATNPLAAAASAQTSGAEPAGCGPAELGERNLTEPVECDLVELVECDLVELAESGRAELIDLDEPADLDELPRVRFEEEPDSPEVIKARFEALKALLAEQVRCDSRERAELTPEDVMVALHLDLRCGKVSLEALVAGMAVDERYLDVKAITTGSGMFFGYSEDHIPAEEALAKSIIEEAKFMLASAIRSDSRESVKLTPVSDLYAMAPDTDCSIIDVLLKGMPSEPRYADIKKATAADGAVYFHSDNYLTGSYAATLMLAMAGNHLQTIAETIREESRIYPRTTNVAIFRDQKVYGVPVADLDTVLWHLVRKPEYADIKRIVHPVTRAIHMYSSDFIDAERAWAMMDWEEVGRANNP